MFKKSITLKLTFGFLTIVIISTVLVGTIALSIFKNNIYQIKKNNMKNHALEISHTIEPYMSQNTKESSNIIKAMDSLSTSKIWIVNLNREILTTSQSQENNLVYINNAEIKKIYSILIEKSLTGVEESDEIYNPYYNQYMITTIVPIKNTDGQIIGSVILHSSITDLSNSMKKFFIYLILSLLLEILIAGFMGYYFSKIISKPIKIINTSALEMAQGKYGIKTNIDQKDEIGELSNSFNLLSLKLKHTIGELFEEKNKLSNIVTSMNEGILALDKNFDVININQSALDLLSLKDDKPNLKVNTLLEQLNLIQEFKAILHSNEKKSIITEYSNKILNFSISPICNNSIEIIGIVVLIQDISEKEKLEQMRKDFISNVSHEFKTPLTIIKGNLESIIDGMIKQEYIKDICFTLLKETNRLERMVKDLLDLSKLESGKVDVYLNELNVNLVISDTIRNIKPLVKDKDITLKTYLQDNLPPLYSDYDKLKQLLIIFLDNAIKFSKNKSEIAISTFNDNTNIYITIKDNGIGISKDEIYHLGERFFKSDRSRSSSINGTGLGLSIAKQLIKILNGNFTIESELNKGTIITISLQMKKL